MTNTSTMRNAPSTFQSLYWPVAGFLAGLLLILWIAGFGPNGRACKVPVAPTEASSTATPGNGGTAPTAMPASVQPAPVVASTAVPAVQKLYFAVNSAELDATSRTKTTAIADYLKANPQAKAVLSGFHDPSGDRARNEELALNRARTVRSALEATGISRDRMVMAKPALTEGAGNPAEARRVELSVQP